MRAITSATEDCGRRSCMREVARVFFYQSSSSWLIHVDGICIVLPVEVPKPRNSG